MTYKDKTVIDKIIFVPDEKQPVKIRVLFLQDCYFCAGLGHIKSPFGNIICAVCFGERVEEQII